MPRDSHTSLSWTCRKNLRAPARHCFFCSFAPFLWTLFTKAIDSGRDQHTVHQPDFLHPTKMKKIPLSTTLPSIISTSIPFQTPDNFRENSGHSLCFVTPNSFDLTVSSVKNAFQVEMVRILLLLSSVGFLGACGALQGLSLMSYVRVPATKREAIQAPGSKSMRSSSVSLDLGWATHSKRLTTTLNRLDPLALAARVHSAYNLNMFSRSLLKGYGYLFRCQFNQFYSFTALACSLPSDRKHAQAPRHITVSSPRFFIFSGPRPHLGLPKHSPAANPRPAAPSCWPITSHPAWSVCENSCTTSVEHLHHPAISNKFINLERGNSNAFNSGNGMLSTIWKKDPQASLQSNSLIRLMIFSGPAFVGCKLDWTHVTTNVSLPGTPWQIDLKFKKTAKFDRVSISLSIYIYVTI